MKTLVSIVTGRKDYPIFDCEDDDKIIEHLKTSDWSEGEVQRDVYIPKDIVVQDSLSIDVFKIINVPIVKL